MQYLNLYHYLASSTLHWVPHIRPHFNILSTHSLHNGSIWSDMYRRPAQPLNNIPVTQVEGRSHFLHLLGRRFAPRTGWTFLWLHKQPSTYFEEDVATFRSQRDLVSVAISLWMRSCQWRFCDFAMCGFVCTNIYTF